MQLHKTLISSLTLATLVALPTAGFAAGSSDDDEKPEPTETVMECPDGQIYDAEQELCVEAKEEAFLDTDRLNEAHSLATYGRAVSAMAILDTLEQPDTSKAQTIIAFTARKLGDMDKAMGHYDRALELDPNNILAMSYMGQGLLKSGDEVGAYTQLQKIAMVDGKDNWPYRALRDAISGLNTDY